MSEKILPQHVLLDRDEFQKQLELRGYTNRNANGGLFGKLIRNNIDDPNKWTADNISYPGVVGRGLEGSLISIPNLKKNVDRLPEIKELGEASLTMCVELVESILPTNP